MAWAELHLDELKTLLKRWRAFDKQTITKHEEPLHGRYVVTIHTLGHAPSSIALLLSDFIYATRSALDHLAWQLSRLTIPIPPTEVMFPIHASPDPKSEKRFLRRVQGMPAAAVDEIRNLQPYKRGAAYRDDLLWKLNELSNIDKHRIFAIGANTMDAIAQPPGYTMRRFDYGCEFAWPISMKDRVVFEPYATEFVFGKPIDLPGDIVEVREREIAKIHRYVRDDVLPRFARFFP